MLACIGSFVGCYEGIGKYVPPQITLSIPAETFQDLSRTGYDIVLSTWEEDPFSLCYLRTFFTSINKLEISSTTEVMMVGRGIYYIRRSNCKKINISFNAILVDDVGVVYLITRVCIYCLRTVVQMEN